MTDRKERLNAFVVGDLRDAEKALALIVDSDELDANETCMLHFALHNVRSLLYKREGNHDGVLSA